MMVIIHGKKPRAYNRILQTLCCRSKEDYDWGISQLDAVMERKEISGSLFLVLTNFGDHALHHMFPTLDHSTLEHLYPVFKKVSRCRDYIDFRKMFLKLSCIQKT